MRNSISFLIFLVISLPVWGQSFRAFSKAGDEALAARDYYAAMYYFNNALEREPDNISIQYKYAEAARQFASFEQAEAFYRKVIKRDKTGQFPDARFWLAMVYKQMGNYRGAVEQFEKYIQQGGAQNAALVEKAGREIDHSAWVMELIARPDSVVIGQLGRGVNTPYSEFGALRKGDTLYYSSLRFERREDTYRPKRRISKTLYQKDRSRGRILRNNFNDDNLHTAHIVFSLDGKRTYFTLCDYINASEIRCDLYYRERTKTGKAVRLPDGINGADYTSTHPSIGYDSLMQVEVLYFASDREGGQGRLDIWRVRVEADSGFSDPENLAAVNTPGNDITPFFHSHSQALYFSSDGRRGMGGYDVYQWKNNTGPTGVVHMGYPLNSSYNDVYFTLLPDEKLGYLSSNRSGSLYLDRDNKACCNDIYEVRWPEPLRLKEDSNTVAIAEDVNVEGENPDSDDLSGEAPEILEDFLPLTLYFDNDKPDPRTRRTTTRRNYEETFRRFYRRQSDYVEKYTGPLSEDEREEATQRIHQFFKNDVKKGYDHLLLFSDLLLERLQEGEKIEIFIKGFTSPRARSDYNLALGKRRISSLINHFKTYKEGIFRDYLESGNLLITERSFGETIAASSISDDLEDQRNSVYSVGAALERRVEIVEIQRN